MERTMTVVLETAANVLAGMVRVAGVPLLPPLMERRVPHLAPAPPVLVCGSPGDRPT